MGLEIKLHQDLADGHLVLDRKLKTFKDKNGAIPLNLERALLIVSGVDTEKKLMKYISKINNIHHKFELYRTQKNEEAKRKDPYLGIDFRSHDLVAQHLHEFLWETRPNRYDKNSSPLLKSVIDAQMSWFRKKKPVGNALGLTSLYTILGLRNGLNFYVVFKPDHFKPKRVSTLLTRKKRGGEILYIDNAIVTGFPTCIIRGVKHDKNKDENFKQLISHVYKARGKLKEKQKNYTGALDDYHKALSFFSGNVSAQEHLDKFWDRIKIKEETTAIERRNNINYYHKNYRIE